jgi:hypothetical protein
VLIGRDANLPTGWCVTDGIVDEVAQQMLDALPIQRRLQLWGHVGDQPGRQKGAFSFEGTVAKAFQTAPWPEA